MCRHSAGRESRASRANRLAPDWLGVMTSRERPFYGVSIFVLNVGLFSMLVCGGRSGFVPLFAGAGRRRRMLRQDAAPRIAALRAVDRLATGRQLNKLPHNAASFSSSAASFRRGKSAQGRRPGQTRLKSACPAAHCGAGIFHRTIRGLPAPADAVRSISSCLSFA
jgi:hypothetical protein